MRKKQHSKKPRYTPEEIEEEEVIRARALYISRPYATKVYMATYYKFSMEFLNKHWDKITSN